MYTGRGSSVKWNIKSTRSKLKNLIVYVHVPWFDFMSDLCKTICPDTFGAVLKKNCEV